jgi:hypothetical protein
MNAFKFGRMLYKIAAAPPDNVVPPNSPSVSDPDYQAIRTNLAKANLPAAAWQHAGLPAMTADQLNSASARDVWHINQQLAKAPRATYRRGSDPRQVNAFNALRGKSIGMGKQYNPVFAAEGAPGYKPPLASIQGLAAPAAKPAAPAAPAPPPAPPAPPNPVQFGGQVAQGLQQPQGAIPGEPLPTSSPPLAPGFVQNDLGKVTPMSPDYIRMKQQGAVRARQQPAVGQ